MKFLRPGVTGELSVTFGGKKDSDSEISPTMFAYINIPLALLKISKGPTKEFDMCQSFDVGFSAKAVTPG